MTPRHPPARQHRVDGAAQRVHVALGTVGLPSGQYLGSYETGGAELPVEAPRVRILLVGNHARVREVDQLEIAVGGLGRVENVGGLDVPVHYALSMQEGQALADGPRGLPSGLFVQPLLPLNAVCQGLGAQPLHDKVVHGFLRNLLRDRQAEASGLAGGTLKAAEKVHDVRVGGPGLQDVLKGLSFLLYSDSELLLTNRR
mmetsp:Transcript_87107/g.275105  ORF Transcript_87107/g.275105 Transcript_87107/m.275105 type:complete len:200 (-) Transcript_87107:354-953(-)